MMRAEFEELLRNKVTDEQYEEIQYVYTFHPSISETEGKKQIVEIYKLGGMLLIKDMIPSANVAEELEDKILYHQKQLEEYKQRLIRLKLGGRI